MIKSGPDRVDKPNPDGGFTYKPLTRGGPFYSIGVGSFYVVKAIFGSIAHFERRLISERTRDGIAAARKRGRTPGRSPLRNSARLDCLPLELQNNSSPFAGIWLTESQRRCVEVETVVLRSLRVILRTNLAMAPTTTERCANDGSAENSILQYSILEILPENRVLRQNPSCRCTSDGLVVWYGSAQRSGTSI